VCYQDRCQSQSIGMPDSLISSESEELAGLISMGGELLDLVP